MGIRKCVTLTISILLCVPASASAGSFTHQQLRVWRLIHHYWPKRYTQARQVARCESNYIRTAHNPSGASGVFQLMPFWWDGTNAYGWTFNPYDIRSNLYYAHEIFRHSHFNWSQWTCQPRSGA